MKKKKSKKKEVQVWHLMWIESSKVRFLESVLRNRIELQETQPDWVKKCKEHKQLIKDYKDALKTLSVTSYASKSLTKTLGDLSVRVKKATKRQKQMSSKIRRAIKGEK